jgi:tetratricopeptide (TPR) repeat protein
MPDLTLEAEEVRDAWHWSWRLKDDKGNLLAHHEVAIEPAEAQAEAFFDLYRYVRSHADPGRWEQTSGRILGAVGEWAGEKVLGAVGPAIVKQGTPVTVRVVLPGDQTLAEGLQYLPLELAHVEGEPLALQDVSLVFESHDGSSPVVDNKTPVGDRLRMLAVFSLPTDGQALNLRYERHKLKEAIRSLTSRGLAIDLRVLQYGVTVEALGEILREGEGWDLIHFSGHGLASGLLLEQAEGTKDVVEVDKLIELLRPARERLKWVTLSACWSGAATVAETRRWLGLGESHRHEAAEDVGKDNPKLTSVASALVRALDCAVLAMRYPVGDEFAIVLCHALYEMVFEKGQPLTRALQLTLPTASQGRGALCVATPVLFGKRAAGLKIQVPVAPWGETDPSAVGGMSGFPTPGPHFVGRVGVMAQAGAALAPRSPRTAVLFHGMTGAGKTACATELAYNYGGLKRFRGFVWYEAPKQGSETATSLGDFARAFETQLSDENLNPRFPLVHMVAAEESKFDAYLPRLRQFLVQWSVLVVLDNLETLLRPDGAWIDPRWGKLVATLLAHEGGSRVVLTSRVVPKLSTPPGPPVAGDLTERLLRLPIHALTFDEAVLLARQLPNLGGLLKGRPGSSDADRERDRDLVKRTLRLVQGHPEMIKLAEAQAADRNTLIEQLDKAEQAWLAGGVGGGELSSFFSAGESNVEADAFLRALFGWTDAVAATLPEASRTLFHVLCCCEEDDRQSPVLEANWSNIWKRLALAGEPPALAATLAPLVRVGLVDERPVGDAAAAPAVRTFAIHPGVAEAGRAAAGDRIQAAVDTELSEFWVANFRRGIERETEGDGGLVTLAGRRGAPYLMRRQDWRSATILLERVLGRDWSLATVAAVLPLLDRIVEATKGTDGELINAGVLAKGLWLAGRIAEAEARTREILARATERGEDRVASVAAGALINLLRQTGRAEEALGVVETRKEFIRRAGLGPWTELGDDVMRLQLLADLGQYDEVLAEVEALRPRMDALPLTGIQEESADTWEVRAHLLEVGRSAAMKLERWKQALAFNAEVVAVTKARGAPALAVARARYNDYFPLIRLGRLAEAHTLLMACLEVFESASERGAIFTALAGLDDARGHRDRAIDHERTALRYKYVDAAGDPANCAMSHFNLAGYLLRGGGLPAEALAHGLASAVIRFQTADGWLPVTLQALARYLASFAPSEPPLPGDFAGLCAIVDQVEGVNLAALFERLPRTRAATGDDALRQVLEQARALPVSQ